MMVIDLRRVFSIETFRAKIIQPKRALKERTSVFYSKAKQTEKIVIMNEKKRKMGEKGESAYAKKSKPEWPIVKPKPNLQITRLKDNDLFTVQNIFSSAESKAFVKTAEAIGFVNQGSRGPAYGEAYRDNGRISVDDPVLANLIWESGLNKLFSGIKIRGKVAVGLNPNIRFYRYQVGQHFGRHIDESVHLGEGKRTHYTLLIYLNGSPVSKSKTDLKSQGDSSSDPLVGGETVFYGSRNRIVAEVAPTEGMALLHIHGEKCMLHEARTVTEGVKYLFRSDVIFA